MLTDVLQSKMLRTTRCCRGTRDAAGVQGTTKTNSKDLSIILPLSLVRRLVRRLDHPGAGAELKELDPPKGLGEQIRKLILGVDVARLDVSFLQAASDEVIPHPDVLAPFVENGVLR